MESYILLEFLVIYYYIEECYSLPQFYFLFGQFDEYLMSFSGLDFLHRIPNDIHITTILSPSLPFLIYLFILTYCSGHDTQEQKVPSCIFFLKKRMSLGFYVKCEVCDRFLVESSYQIMEIPFHSKFPESFYCK